MNKKPILAIVVPCFNEEEVIGSTAIRLSEILDSMIESDDISEKSFICFIDDGSLDKTWDILRQQHISNSRVKVIGLSRNFGHQNALLAGMLEVRDFCDCIVSIDADLQQDEKKIPIFIQKYKEGCEVVFGVRETRRSDSLFKKSTAILFYRLMRALGFNIIENHADYRLVGGKALDALEMHVEVNLFLRGLFVDMGFKTGVVLFETKSRNEGSTKYNFWKMLSFALTGITSYSTVPLRLVTISGFITFALSLLMAFYILYIKLTTNEVAPGWASTVIPIYFIGGIQIISIGIIGEYLGKVYKEVKARPRYLVSQKLF